VTTSSALQSDRSGAGRAHRAAASATEWATRACRDANYFRAFVPPLVIIDDRVDYAIANRPHIISFAN